MNNLKLTKENQSNIFLDLEVAEIDFGFSMSIAKYLILDKYSVYDFISDIPVEADVSIQTVSKLRDYIESTRLKINTYERSFTYLRESYQGAG